MSDSNAQRLIFRELRLFLDPLLRMDGDAATTFAFLAEAGWHIEAALGTSGTRVVDAIGRLTTAAADLGDLIDTPPDGLDDLAAALEDVAAILQVIADLPGEVSSLPIDVTELPADVLNALALIYVSRRSPSSYHLLRLLTLIRDPEPRGVVDGDRVLRVRNQAPRLELSRLADLVSDPGRLFAETYWPEGFRDRPTANAVAARLFPRIAAVLASLVGGGSGMNVNVGLPRPRDLPPADRARLEGMMRAYWETFLADAGDWVRVGASLGLIAEDEGGPGVFVGPFGRIAFEERIGDLFLRASGELATGGFEVTPSGFQLYDSGDVATRAEILLSPASGEGPDLRLGSPEGTRLEAGDVSVQGVVGYSDEVADLGVMVGIERAALVIQAGEDDGFLGSILPEDGARLEFDLRAGWTKASGFHFEGSGGFELKVPVHIELGPIQLEDVTVRALVDPDGVPISLGAGVRAQLGPLTAVIENMGVRLALTFPDSGGNLGPLHLEPGIKPPDGIGLSLDAGGFAGGGYLAFEPEKSRYSGVLELSFQGTISLKAIGLLTTELPDGSEGFSLLIVISAEFTPIQLGFGFTLNGVGGLLGLNRTVKINSLREGVKTGALSSVLFPEDVVANATELISDLRQTFPPQKDRFAFGPMAKLGWGSPTLVSVELGLIIEVPSPVRVAILGVVKLVLPDEEAELIKVQVNFLGAWEEDKQLISFDASLYDSRILAFTLTGDMALRLAYGENPNFLASIGGFHPSYTPPPLALPELARLSLSLLDGDNPRLALEAYFAVTSNTVQVGARVELLARAGKFNLYGFLGFDGLFQFSPFLFIVQVGGGLAVRVGEKALFGVTFDMALSGPTPWNAKGTATFAVLFFDITVRFDETWGEQRDTTLPDVDVLPKLVEALSARDSTEAVLPARTRVLVTLRDLAELPPEEIVVHPAGTVTVRQKIVPLNTRIDRFGTQNPADATRFSISVRSGGDELATEPVFDMFAPFQYRAGEAAEKLSSPSFESMQAGVRAAAGSDDLDSSRIRTRDVRYETVVVDTRLRLVRVGLLAELWRSFSELLAGSAVARSTLSLQNRRRTEDRGPGKIRVDQEGFTVVGVVDLLPHDGQSSFRSEAAARAYIEQIVRDKPAFDGELQVVADYELEETA